MEFAYGIPVPEDRVHHGQNMTVASFYTSTWNEQLDKFVGYPTKLC